MNAAFAKAVEEEPAVPSATERAARVADIGLLARAAGNAVTGGVSRPFGEAMAFTLRQRSVKTRPNGVAARCGRVFRLPARQR